MLLGVVKRGLWLGEMVVDVAGDVALEAAECFFFGEALFHASRDVVAGSWVADHAGDDDVPQRRVRVAIAAPVESVSLVFATAGIDGCDTAEMSEAGFVAELFGIVAGCDEQCAAMSVPTPTSAGSSGAVSATRISRMASMLVISSSSARARRASRRSVNFVAEMMSRRWPGR